MRWIDGKEINIRQFTGETLCEKLETDLWSNYYDQWLKCADFIQTASFLIAFDTELTMEGIFAFLENSIGHYAPNIIQAFRIIGDKNDADILEKICQIAPPDIMRGEFLSETQQEYDITTFNDDHELNEEAEARIEELNKQLYLHSGIDIWSLLFTYLDEQIENLDRKSEKMPEPALEQIKSRYQKLYWLLKSLLVSPERSMFMKKEDWEKRLRRFEEIQS